MCKKGRQENRIVECRHAGQTKGQQENAEAVKVKNRYPGKNIGSLPSCVVMGSGRPRQYWN